MASFEYKPLSLSPPEIRLLKLSPGTWGADIRCDLNHASLDAKPHYEALSYTWGDANDRRSILLDGRRFNVTKNLEVALRHLRHEHVARTLWVDALCINQGDLVERGKQVLKMKDIFATAWRVLAWTGEASDDSDEAVALVQELGAFMKSNDKMLPTVNLTSQHFKDLGLDLQTKNWLALWNFLERPYWSRVWVIQELVVKTVGPTDQNEEIDGQCSVGCGSKWVSKRPFDWACLLLIMIVSRAGQYIQPNGVIDQPFATFAAKGPPAGLRMCTTLLHFADLDDDSVSFTIRLTSHHKATDSRDKIYALLNIGSGWVRNFLPDYSKSTEEVFTSLVKYSIDCGSDLDILLGNRQESTKNEFGPSWFIQAQGYPPDGPAWINQKGLLRAAAGLPANAKVDEEKGLLLAHGILVGVLKDVIGPFAQIPEKRMATSTAYEVSEFIKDTAIEASLDELVEFCRSQDETGQETAWRTLTMDQDLTDWDEIVFPAPIEFGKMLRVFLKVDEVPEEFEPEFSQEHRDQKYTFPFLRNMDTCIMNRCFFSTECGRMGLGPYSTKVGDIVVILFGSALCFLLRPKGSQYELIGDAYVQGVMRGELAKGFQNGHIKAEEFVLC